MSASIEGSNVRILITGGAGYIGSVLTNQALQKGHSVTAVDLLWFDRRIPTIHLSDPRYTFVHGDIGDKALMAKLLEGVDFVIHTAAVVGDPASKLFPELTQRINEDASLQLIGLAQQAGIKGFIFFSTCSNYGVADSLATEESPLNPLSLYAQTKVNVERHLMDEVKGMDWVIGRLSTIYGASPRMRFDLTVNDFTLAAYRDKLLQLFLPESYRPYIHVLDLSRIMMEVVDRFDGVKNNVYNIGFPGENYQKIRIAQLVQQEIPGVKVEILKEGGDKRDYQVDFTKLHTAITIEQVFNVERSVKEIHVMLREGYVVDPAAPIHYNTTPFLS